MFSSFEIWLIFFFDWTINEHKLHVGDFAYVPARDVLVEASCMTEHMAHISHFACVPF
jgi:hypothetical protein